MIKKTQNIFSLDLPELEVFKTLRRPLEHNEKGIFVAEGEKVVLRLLESDLKTISILLTERWFELYKSVIEKKDEAIDIFIGEEKLLQTIVGHKMHQSIIALAKIPAPTSIDEIIKLKSKPILFVAIDEIMNAENLGVIIRNCVAFGVDGLIVGETSADPYLRRAVRNSMGNIFKLPIIYCNNLISTLNDLKNKNFELFVVHSRKTSQPIFNADFTKDCCIIFGSEGNGPRKIIIDSVPMQLIIPMSNGVDSLNVANASAVFLYEVQRQRKN